MALFGGVLSEKNNRKIPLNEAADYCAEFLSLDVGDIQESEVTQNEHVRILEVFNKIIVRESAKLTREEIRASINIPSDYFIDRGFKAKTLDLFDVGECLTPNKPMSSRAVVPVYDENHNYVGCVGRSTRESMKPKWLHSKGFKKSVLYGMNIAKNEIAKTKTAILVEGQGDVWRMHEAGFYNCVGIFGSSLNDDQLFLLEKSGALNLVVLTDSDDAGNKAYDKILKICGRRFNYYRPTISQKDVGDMTIEQIKEELIPQIEGIFQNEK